MIYNCNTHDLQNPNVFIYEGSGLWDLSLDPASCFDGLCSGIAVNIFDSLIDFDGDHYNPKLYLIL